MVGPFYTELYKIWPPSNVEYEERKGFFGSVVLSIRLDWANARCFLTFSSGQSLANGKLYSPVSGKGNVSQAGEFDDALKPSMTSGAVTQETAEVSHSVRKDLSRSS